MMREAGQQDWLQNMEREEGTVHWYWVREEAEVTCVLKSFYFLLSTSVSSQGSLWVCSCLYIMWEQGALCNPIWFRAFCLSSWAHSTALHVFDSGMGFLGGCLEGSGKWRGLRLDRGKKCKVGYWSTGTIWLWLMLCSVTTKKGKKGPLLKFHRHKPQTFSGLEEEVAGCWNSCCFAITDVFLVRSSSEEVWQMATKGKVQTRHSCNINIEL